MTNLYSILKNRDITLPTKVHIVKAMVFPGVMYGCESWIIKKAESWRIRCFWTAMLEKTLESPSDCMEIKLVHPKGNQSWVENGRNWCSNWNSSNLATWCNELTHWKRPWCWEILKAGEEGDRRWDDWMASPIQWAWVWASSGSWWWTGRPGVLQSMGLQRVWHDWAAELSWRFCH